MDGGGSTKGSNHQSSHNPLHDSRTGALVVNCRLRPQGFSTFGLIFLKSADFRCLALKEGVLLQWAFAPSGGGALFYLVTALEGPALLFGGVYNPASSMNLTVHPCKQKSKNGPTSVFG